MTSVADSEVLEALKCLVVKVAREELLPRQTGGDIHYKADGSVVTEADLAIQSRLAEELRGLLPDIPLLGEEMEASDQLSLLTQAREGLWCLDPLDGTNNFATGLPVYSISIALLRQGVPWLGLVYDPCRGELFSALKGQGAWLNDRPLGVQSFGRPLRRALAVIDFKRLPKDLARDLISQPPTHSWRYLGSGAIEWCWLAAGRCHVYLHGQQKLWDFAAGALVFMETGGVAMTLEGRPLFPATRLSASVVAAADAALFEAWTRALGLRREAD